VPWIDAVRATPPGRLAMGQGLHAFDLVCYVIGVALGVGLIEEALLAPSSRTPTWSGFSTSTAARPGSRFS
jgi:hypothetical protein